MRAVLISNGDLRDINLLREVAGQADFVLAADGGANHCLRAGLLPDLIIGDLDSIDRDALNLVGEKGIKLLKYPSRKNSSDTEICLDYLIEEGFKEIDLLGSLGSRWDHSLANIYLLEDLLDKGVDGRIIDEKNTIYLVEGQRYFKKERTYLSILAISDKGIVVSLEGLEYPLDHKSIERGSSLGISNECRGSNFMVHIHKGRALVIEAED